MEAVERLEWTQATRTNDTALKKQINKIQAQVIILATRWTEMDSAQV